MLRPPIAIIEWFETINNTIIDIEIFNFNDKDESFVTFEECDATIEKYPKVPGNAQKTSIQNYTSR